MRLPEVLRSLPDPFVDTTLERPQIDERFQTVQAAIDYEFGNKGLLRVALTLGSWVNEHPKAGWPSNGCLEFFGDAVLNLVAADAIWQRFPELDEGALTRLRASIVSERALSEIAIALDLGSALWVGRGDRKRGAALRTSTLADAVEAVLGAAFLDARQHTEATLPVADRVFERMFAAHLAALQPEAGIDPKSRLQHWAQTRHRVTPSYVQVGEAPPPGEPLWRSRVELRFDDGRIQVLGEGEGRSRKRAERSAAAQALDAIERESTGD
jgi:ribonuclease-3